MTWNTLFYIPQTPTSAMIHSSTVTRCLGEFHWTF